MNIKRFVAAIIVFAMIFTFIGCKSSGDDSSDLYEIQEEYVYVDGDKSSNNSTVIQSEKENNSSYIVDTPYYTMPPYYGTTVKFAVTSDPMDSEKAPVIESFEKKFGMKIEPVILKGDFGVKFIQ